MTDLDRTTLRRVAPAAAWLVTQPEIDLSKLREPEEFKRHPDAFEGMVVDNRYRLDKVLGAGGFATVFSAFDMREKRRVAIKILQSDAARDERVQVRFRREALATRRVRHRGIVEVFDFSMGAGPYSYIVMEELRGSDLASLLERSGPLHPRRAASLIVEAARALEAAHRAGVLHRDLKPANVFVSRDASLHSVKVIDFGIAKDQGSNPRTQHLTTMQRVVGTPLYMSPEQARGATLDGRADVYSLGIILYELLCGERPIDGETVYEILIGHSKQKRIKPSARRAGLSISPRLEDIVLRSIEPKRGARFDSMAAFADALEDYLHGGAEESYALPPPPPQASTIAMDAQSDSTMLIATAMCFLAFIASALALLAST